MRVLVLGAGGMVGNTVFRFFVSRREHELLGTVRSGKAPAAFSAAEQSRLACNVDVLNQDAIARAIAGFRPEVVINCVALVKQLPGADDPLAALPLNSIFPHRLANLCAIAGSRLIHLSTDCVFSGRKGGYRESDPSDAEDLYGKSKYIGEIHDQAHVLTLRTSAIGHELGSRHGLVEWFLAQKGEVKGYSKAIFSGLATVELARVIHDFALPAPGLKGLYHLSARPIAKLDLLREVANRYQKKIRITPDSDFRIDRSLDSARFTAATGYVAPDWAGLVDLMYKSRLVKQGPADV